MYTFFINNTSISFQRESTITKDTSNKVFVIKSTFDITKNLFSLSKEIDFQDVIFVCADPDKVISTMISDLGMIEAGGGIVNNNKQEILFIYRRNKWDLPKGKLDKGETIEECAIREVQEECGIHAVKIVKPIVQTFHFFIPKKKGGFIIKKTSWFEMVLESDEQPIPQAEEGITAIQWFSKNNFHVPLNNTFAMVKSIILDLK